MSSLVFGTSVAASSEEAHFGGTAVAIVGVHAELNHARSS